MERFANEEITIDDDADIIMEEISESKEDFSQAIQQISKQSLKMQNIYHTLLMNADHLQDLMEFLSLNPADKAVHLMKCVETGNERDRRHADILFNLMDPPPEEIARISFIHNMTPEERVSLAEKICPLPGEQEFRLANTFWELVESSELSESAAEKLVHGWIEQGLQDDSASLEPSDWLHSKVQREIGQNVQETLFLGFGDDRNQIIVYGDEQKTMELGALTRQDTTNSPESGFTFNDASEYLSSKSASRRMKILFDSTISINLGDPLHASLCSKLQHYNNYTFPFLAGYGEGNDRCVLKNVNGDKIHSYSIYSAGSDATLKEISENLFSRNQEKVQELEKLLIDTVRKHPWTFKALNDLAEGREGFQKEKNGISHDENSTPVETQIFLNDRGLNQHIHQPGIHQGNTVHKAPCTDIMLDPASHGLSHTPPLGEKQCAALKLHRWQEIFFHSLLEAHMRFRDTNKIKSLDVCDILGLSPIAASSRRKTSISTDFPTDLPLHLRTKSCEILDAEVGKIFKKLGPKEISALVALKELKRHRSSNSEASIQPNDKDKIHKNIQKQFDFHTYAPFLLSAENDTIVVKDEQQNKLGVLEEKNGDVFYQAFGHLHQEDFKKYYEFFAKSFSKQQKEGYKFPMSTYHHITKKDSIYHPCYHENYMAELKNLVHKAIDSAETTRDTNRHSPSLLPLPLSSKHYWSLIKESSDFFYYTKNNQIPNSLQPEKKIEGILHYQAGITEMISIETDKSKSSIQSDFDNSDIIPPPNTRVHPIGYSIADKFSYTTGNESSESSSLRHSASRSYNLGGIYSLFSPPLSTSIYCSESVLSEAVGMKAEDLRHYDGLRVKLLNNLGTVHMLVDPNAIQTSTAPFPFQRDAILPKNFNQTQINR